jgi:hypothetical protein
MNMKRKIRKAFKNATPYVLDRVAPPAKQDISRQAYTPTEEETPAPKRNWRELVAMAAALALIIGSLASGVQFIRDKGQVGPGQTGGVPTYAPNANDPSGTIGVIDFNRWEVGDPWEEFYKLESFGREVSVPYCAGQIDAYFEDAVPEDFWETLAVYVAHASLYSIKWAEKFGQEDIDGMVRRCLAAMEHYDGFKKVIPSWYEAYKKTMERG